MLQNLLHIVFSGSGSIEGVSPTSSGDNLISTLSGDTASVGTWRLIKGKVSQTFEDIKSSKTSSQALSTSVPKVESPRQHFQQLLNDPESDPDNPTTHSSISDDLLFDLERKSPHLKGGDSDSSADGEQLPESEAEYSRLRRGLANLKSKVKSKPHHHSQSHQSSSHSAQQTGLATAALSSATISTAFGTAAIKPMKRESTGSNSSSKGSLRDAFLRRRRPSPTDQTDRTVLVPRLEPNEAQPTDKKASAKIKKRGIISGKKEVEIESGVEMMEDTLPTLPDDSNRIDEPGTSMGHRNDLHLHFKSDEEWFKIGPSQSTYNEAAEVGDHQQQEINTQRRDEQILPRENERECKNIQAKTKFATSMPISRVAVLLIVLLLPVHGFIRGVLACLMSFAIADSLSIIAQAFIYKFFQSHPEQSEFEIPDYTKLPICKVPAVEEHKTVKSYTGWMNEIFSYDPVTFHITQTNSVYLRLDGTILRVSTTLARIPKRVMWNEQPIDIKHIHFTGHRIFNLLGCNVELLPLGLARKRYFNRKYPIQLIIKRSAEDDTYLDLSEQPSNEHSATGSRTEVHSTDSRLSQISNEVLEQYTDLKETNANSQDVDFASAIMNADLQQLQDDTQNNDTLIPCGDEVRLILFARADREKEDWYRRFVAASEGDVHDQVLRLPNLKLVDDAELQRAAAKAAQMPLDPNAKRDVGSSENDNNADNESLVLPPDMAPPLVVESKSEFKDIPDDMEVVLTPTETFEGLLMSSCAARNPQDYIRFMAIYQGFKSLLAYVLVNEGDVCLMKFWGMLRIQRWRYPCTATLFVANLIASAVLGDISTENKQVFGACKEDRIPVYATPIPRDKHDKSRRSRRNANELWKGIDQSLFLGPSGSVVWANVLIGRVLYSCLHDSMVKDKIKELLQKKISAIKLPSFIEDIIITKINLGDTPPLIHRVSQPFLDERGTWVDADITYEGLLQLTVTTKLNLMRIKQQKRPTDGINITVPNPMHTVTNTSAPNGTSSTGVTNTTAIPPINVISDAEARRIPTTRLPLDELNADDVATSVIFDSDAESTGDSDTDPESVSAPMASTLSNVGLTSSASGIAPQSDTATGAQSDYNFIPTAPGNARRIFRIVDRIAASNFFQYATDLPVVQRAIENMNTNITLRIDLRGLVGRGVINIPPPPSDRIWLSFRGPPRLWLSAKPALGEKSVDYSIVTSIIESKLCEVVNKFLVYPNMVDVTIPFLGQPTYEYLRGEKTKRTE